MVDSAVSKPSSRLASTQPRRDPSTRQAAALVVMACSSPSSKSVSKSAPTLRGGIFLQTRRTWGGQAEIADAAAERQLEWEEAQRKRMLKQMKSINSEGVVILAAVRALCAEVGQAEDETEKDGVSVLYLWPE